MNLKLGFTFILIFTNAWAGNLSDLVRCGTSGSEISGVVGNQTYFTVGGEPNYCRSSALSSFGGYTHTNVNDGNTCGAGKVCSRGRCTSTTVTCSDSSIVGDICTGGAVYAGQNAGFKYMITPSNCRDLTCSNMGTALAGDTYTRAWARDVVGATAYGVVTGTSETDGVTNTNNLAGNYIDTDAAKFCQNLNFGGYTDWYLPARSELQYIATIRASLGFDTSGAYYWTSSETGTVQLAYSVRFSDGGLRASDDRKLSLRVRCVRRF